MNEHQMKRIEKDLKQEVDVYINYLDDGIVSDKETRFFVSRIVIPRLVTLKRLVEAEMINELEEVET